MKSFYCHKSESVPVIYGKEKFDVKLLELLYFLYLKAVGDSRVLSFYTIKILK